MLTADDLACAKSAGQLRNAFDKFADKSGFILEVVRIAEHSPYQKQATWMIKRYLETGRPVEQQLQNRIVDLLSNTDSWESSLHLLQALQYISIPRELLDNVVATNGELLKSKHPFVRAWAYNLAFEVSQMYPEFEKETRHLLEIALLHEAPSVKARIRNIMKNQPTD